MRPLRMPEWPREIPLPGIEHLQRGAHLLFDGHRIVIKANEPGRPGRSFVVNEFGAPRSPSRQNVCTRLSCLPMGSTLPGKAAAGYPLPEWDGQALNEKLKAHAKGRNFQQLWLP